MEDNKLILDNANIKYFDYYQYLYIKERSISYVYLAMLNDDYVYAGQSDLKIKNFSIENILDTDDNLCLFFNQNKLLYSCTLDYNYEELYTDYKKWILKI